MAVPILYSGTRNASSWAMRAWLALREAGIEWMNQADAEPHIWFDDYLAAEGAVTPTIEKTHGS